MLTLLSDNFTRYFVQFMRGWNPEPVFIQAVCPMTHRLLKNLVMLEGETEEQAIDRLRVEMKPYKRLGRGILYRVEDTHFDRRSLGS
jgi:hypothetical protein